MASLSKKYVLMQHDPRGCERELKRFDTEEEIMAVIAKGPPRDLLCDTEWYIREIYTNKEK